jgi:hypothetical protein
MNVLDRIVDDTRDEVARRRWRSSSARSTIARTSARSRRRSPAPACR